MPPRSRAASSAAARRRSGCTRSVLHREAAQALRVAQYVWGVASVYITAHAFGGLLWQARGSLMRATAALSVCTGQVREHARRCACQRSGRLRASAAEASSSAVALPPVCPTCDGASGLSGDRLTTRALAHIMAAEDERSHGSADGSGRRT